MRHAARAHLALELHEVRRHVAVGELVVRVGGEQLEDVRRQVQQLGHLLAQQVAHLVRDIAEM